MLLCNSNKTQPHMDDNFFIFASFAHLLASQVGLALLAALGIFHEALDLKLGRKAALRF